MSGRILVRLRSHAISIATAESKRALIVIPTRWNRGAVVARACARIAVYPTAAITFSSIAIGVGKAVTSIVVRVGFGLPGPAKYSA